MFEEVIGKKMSITTFAKNWCFTHTTRWKDSSSNHYKSYPRWLEKNKEKCTRFKNTAMNVIIQTQEHLIKK